MERPAHSLTYYSSLPLLTTSDLEYAAALLCLVTGELLVEAHEVPETTLSTARFFLGFLILLIIDMVSQGRGSASGTRAETVPPSREFQISVR